MEPVFVNILRSQLKLLLVFCFFFPCNFCKTHCIVIVFNDAHRHISKLFNVELFLQKINFISLENKKINKKKRHYIELLLSNV